jgi:hypothetical protein
MEDIDIGCKGGVITGGRFTFLVYLVEVSTLAHEGLLLLIYLQSLVGNSNEVAYREAKTHGGGFVTLPQSAAMEIKADDLISRASEVRAGLKASMPSSWYAWV